MAKHRAWGVGAGFQNLHLECLTVEPRVARLHYAFQKRSHLRSQGAGVPNGVKYPATGVALDKLCGPRMAPGGQIAKPCLNIFHPENIKKVTINFKQLDEI